MDALHRYNKTESIMLTTHHKRLLHHTALAALFATFGLGHLQEALPSPSVLTPCDYRMLQSQAKRQARLVILETVQRSQEGEERAEREDYCHSTRRTNQ